MVLDVETASSFLPVRSAPTAARPSNTGTVQELRRSKRGPKPHDILSPNPSAKSYVNHMPLVPVDEPTHPTIHPACFHARLYTDWNLPQPFAYASAAKNNPDIFTFDECMGMPEPEKKKWLDAMLAEV